MCCVFCKQKTAYEVRISDRSSDVCTSDRAAALPRPGYPHPLDAVLRTIGPRYPGRDIAVVLEEIQMTPAKLDKIMRFEGQTALTACEGRYTVGFQVKVQLMWRLARVEMLAYPKKRSEERRLGKECVSQGRYRGSPDKSTKKKAQTEKE